MHFMRGELAFIESKYRAWSVKVLKWGISANGLLMTKIFSTRSSGKDATHRDQAAAQSKDVCLQGASATKNQLRRLVPFGANGPGGDSSSFGGIL